MASLGTLLIRIGADAAGLEKDLGKIESKLNKTAKNLSNVGSTLTKGITLPLVAVGAGLFTLATRAGDAADRLLDLEDITGMSTDTLQKLQHVARVAGVDFDGLTNTATFLQKKLMGIENDSGKAAQAMGRLGIDIHDADGNLKDMDDLLPEAIKKLQGMENITERNMLATALFGGAFKDLAPVLGMTTEEMEAAMQEAEDLGLIMGKDALNQANDFRIEMEKVKAQLGMVALSAGTNLAPVLRDVLLPIIQDKIISAVQKMSEKIAAAIKWFGNLDPKVQNIILGIIGFVAAVGPLLLGLGFVLKTIAGIIGALKMIVGVIKTVTILTKVWTAVQAVFNAVMALNPIALIILGIIALIAIIIVVIKYWDEIVVAMKAVWEWIKGVFIKGWEGFIEFWSGIWEAVKGALLAAWEWIKEMFMKYHPIGLVITHWDTIKAFFIGLWDKVKTTFSTALDAVKNYVIERFNAVVSFLTGVKDKIVGVFEKVKTGVLSIWNGIVGGIKGFINLIIDAVNGMISGMNKLKFKAPDWVPKIGGKSWGINIPLIPKLAEGGRIVQPGMAIVGERGPEMLSLPRGAAVQPLDGSGDRNVNLNIDFRGLPAGVSERELKVFLLRIIREPDVMRELDIAGARNTARGMAPQGAS